MKTDQPTVERPDVDVRRWIEINRRHHDRFAPAYKQQHAEIYNEIEQARLHAVLARALSLAGADGASPLALDVGAGAGNLTGHLLDLGCTVVASDVSEGCLEEIERSFPDAADRLETAVLNGIDLSDWPDGHFDFCGTYSVLHHVPDYLALVREMARVTRKGGVLFIDHEASPEAWDPSPDGLEYIALCRQMIRQSFLQRWGPRGLVKRARLKWKKRSNPRYQEEGDIHIWEDDHVEWDEVEDQLRASGCQTITRTDYLVCRERSQEAPVYHAFRERFRDMSLLVAVR